MFRVFQTPCSPAASAGHSVVAAKINHEEYLMIYRKCLRLAIAGLLSTSLFSLSVLGQEAKESKKDTGIADQKKTDQAGMMAMMMEMAKPGDNHKHLQQLTGTWSYNVKWWVSPDAPPSEASGTTVSRPVMDGRYLVSDHTGKMQMPGGDGNVTEMEFKGMAIEGYDNAKKKFVASWIDNMGTGIMNMEGTYDAATKTLTYLAEYEPMPGMKTKMREVVKITDKDHHTMEFFELRGGKEVKTMQIDYTRKA
jgi:Protein of unknown function (DUF1579)